MGSTPRQGALAGVAQWLRAAGLFPARRGFESSRPYVVKRIPVVDRILARILIDPTTGCWVWQGALVKGYGYVSAWSEDQERWVRRYTHVVMWEHSHGPVPAGKVLDHRCENPPCCNPDHLFVNERVANILRTSRMVNHVSHRENRCKRDHPLVGANVRWKKNGTRCCRTCDKLRKRGLI